MKKILTLALVLLLAGCGYSETIKKQKINAESACVSHGGSVATSSDRGSIYYFSFCNDGSVRWKN